MRRAGQVLAALCALALVVGLCGCGGSGGSNGPSVDAAAKKPPPPPPTSSRIAFARSLANANYQVFAMNTDGASPTQLTESGRAGWPSWSPLGDRVAYADGAGETDGREFTRMQEEVTA